MFQKKCMFHALAAVCGVFLLVSTGYCQELGAVHSEALFPATISGSIFIDANQNGIKDEGEQGIAGITVSLNRLHFFIVQEEADTAQTDAEGNYVFSNLRRGIYFVETAAPEDTQCISANPMLAILLFTQNRVVDFCFEATDGDEPVNPETTTTSVSGTVTTTITTVVTTTTTAASPGGGGGGTTPTSTTTGPQSSTTTTSVATTSTVAPTTTTTSSSGGGTTYASSLSQFGITWTFDKAYEVGQFANGDYWIVGPATIVSIANSYHVHGFTPVQGQDGSMINPGTDDKQGYDHSLSSYDASLNVSYPNGQPISANNPLVLGTGQTLISAVSWLYNSDTDTEPGCPLPFNGSTHTPRPVLRTAAVLTCLAASAPGGSFRPPYVGTDKTVRFNVSQLQSNLLCNLSTAGILSIPDVESLEDDFQRVWLDHVHQYLGSYLHPSENMYDYGREIAKKIGDAALMLNLDFSELPGNKTKETLLMEFVQLGIDLAGIADNNGFWPPAGGFHQGRKWPILFAGLMLNDAHMKGVGTWSTIFQEDGNTFYVSQDDVDRTHSPQWNPDSRNNSQPYETSDIGLPEWGITHITDPYRDDKDWDAVYRATSTCSFPGFVLAAHIMGQKQAWNHDALFDFTDRWMAITGGEQQQQKVTVFTKSMWNTYRTNYPPVWAD